MFLPTLYFLTIRYCGNGDWGIFEQHQCQEKGCFKTDEKLIGWGETKEQALELAKEWRPFEGIVEAIEVEE